MEDATLTIEGMSCGHCVAAVRRALEGVPGVEVKDVRIGQAEVRYDPSRATPEQLAEAVEEEGYGAAVGR